MYTKIKILFFGLLTLVIATQCKNNSSSDNANTNTTTSTNPYRQEQTASRSVILTEQFIAGHELITRDLVHLNIIDTSVTTPLNETCYCDTTVQLNDSIFYTVVSVSDVAGLCNYFFIASLNKNNGSVTASRYLHPDCDVDYSLSTYDLHEHVIISNDKIEVTTTTIFQKKNRTSRDEEQKIDHTQKKNSLFVISQTGQINAAK